MSKLGVLATALVMATLAGCASYDGRGLVPGQSSGAAVEALMGKPDERVAHADGSSTWFYPREAGRQTFAVTIGADGVLRGIEQRLTQENLRKLVIGHTTAQQVRELFGPPNLVARAARRPVDVWEYRTALVSEKRVMWIELSDDRRVAGVIEMHDFESDEPTGASMP